MFSTNIKKSIKNLIEKEGYLTYEIKEESIPTNCSYFGQLYEIDVNEKTKDGKEINLFVKVNSSDVNTEHVSVQELYQVELFAYKELSKIFVELQDDANVPLHERYKLVKSYDGSSTEAIILENIARKGFKTNPRTDVISLEFAEVSVRELAKLHGLSFALQEKRPDYFNRMLKDMKYTTNFHCSDWHGFLKNMITLTMKYIDDEAKSRVENTYLKLADKYAEFFEDEATRRCICHGDYKTNNIMFKNNEDEIKDCVIVDYQFLHYGCPAMDIIYFIFIGTDQKFRSAHLTHLKDLYHESLTTFLKYFNVDVESVYSREMFEQDFKEKLDYGLAVGFAILPLVLVSEDDALDITGAVSGRSFHVNEVFKDRQRDLIEEFTKWGYM